MNAGDEGAPAARRVTRVTVRIGGVECQLRGEEQAAYLEGLASTVDTQMAEVARLNPRLSQAQTAILVALRTLDDLVRLKEQHQRVLALVERQWGQRREGQGGAPHARAEGGN